MDGRWQSGCIGLVILVLALPAPATAQDPADNLLPRRPFFGARLGAVPAADSLAVRGGKPGGGVLVLAVLDSSPAARAGLQAGDVILRIGARAVTGLADALTFLHALRPGVPERVAVSRAGRAVILRATPVEWPHETARDFRIWYTSVATADGRRRVIVTHPVDAARHPAIMLIGGIGCFSIDSPSGVDPYRDVLYHFSRRGYATLRVEKSGVGDSQGPPCGTVDFESELAGYRAALDALKRYPFVDSSRVFIFGHSIGGIAAPIVVGRDSAGPSVRGVVILSTVGIAWYEYELANSRRQEWLSGARPDSLEAAMQRKARCAFRFLVSGESSAGVVGSDPDCRPYLSYPASDAYMHQVASINLGSVWRAVRVPVLVLYANSDFVTSRDEHLHLVDAINAMHPGLATFADVPGLDHHMSAEPSMRAAFDDSTPPFNRPYYGVTLEPIVDAWLDLFGRP